jgi:hypothetical protein
MPEVRWSNLTKRYQDASGFHSKHPNLDGVAPVTNE